MTKARLERVRDLLAAGAGCSACASCREKSREGLAIVNTELSKPEAREWRVTWESWVGRRCARPNAEATFDDETAAMVLVGHLTNCDGLFTANNIRIESRTPAGPWERAKRVVDRAEQSLARAKAELDEVNSMYPEVAEQ